MYRAKGGGGVEGPFPQVQAKLERVWMKDWFRLEHKNSSRHTVLPPSPVTAWECNRSELRVFVFRTKSLGLGKLE